MTLYGVSFWQQSHRIASQSFKIGSDHVIVPCKGLFQGVKSFGLTFRDILYGPDIFIANFYLYHMPEND